MAINNSKDCGNNSYEKDTLATFTDEPDLSTSFNDNNSNKDPAYINFQKPYGCGCGKCSLNVFLDGCCTKPDKPAASFPYLNMPGLTGSEKEILRGRLLDDFQKISSEFSELNRTICESLTNREVPTQRVTVILQYLRAFSSSTSHAPLLGIHIDAITSENTIHDIFDILWNYISFFNYQITEHLIHNLGTDYDKVLLCKYKRNLDEYCNRNIFECPSYSTAYCHQAALVLKVEGIEQYSLKNLIVLMTHVSRALSILDHSLRLYGVEEGCVKLIFRVPFCVRDTAFPLSTECIGRLIHLGKSMNKPVTITLVKCGFYLYKIPAASGESVKVEMTLDKDHIYNHGILTRNEAESILSSVDYNCFLVRQSPNAVGCVVYSYKDFGVFNHVKQEGTIDQDFIHKTEGSICLMPVHLQRKAETVEAESEAESSSLGTNTSELSYPARMSGNLETPSDQEYTGHSTGDSIVTTDSSALNRITSMPI